MGNSITTRRQLQAIWKLDSVAGLNWTKNISLEELIAAYNREDVRDVYDLFTNVFSGANKPTILGDDTLISKGGLNPYVGWVINSFGAVNFYFYESHYRPEIDNFACSVAKLTVEIDPMGGWMLSNPFQVISPDYLTPGHMTVARLLLNALGITLQRCELDDRAAYNEVAGDYRKFLDVVNSWDEFCDSLKGGKSGSDLSLPLIKDFVAVGDKLKETKINFALELIGLRRAAGVDYVQYGLSDDEGNFVGGKFSG